MNGRGCVLLPNDGHWQVAAPGAQGPELRDLQVPAPASPPYVAAALSHWIAARKTKPGPLLLAVPSQWVLAAPIDTTGLPRRALAGQKGQGPAALAYRLEEQLPLPAEELVVDFLHSRQDAALAVAVPLQRLRPLLEALRQQRLEVRHVVPASLLALQHLPPDMLRTAHLCLWQHREGLDLFRLHDGRPVEWAFLHDPARELALRLHTQTADQTQLPVLACDLSQPLLEILRMHPQVQVAQHPPLGLSAAAADTALAVTAGTLRPWVELHRGALGPPATSAAGRRARVALLAGLVLLAASAVAALLSRAALYQRMAQRAQASQAAAFHQALPDPSLPPDVPARLASELASAQAAQTKLQSAPRPPSALTVLADLLSAMSVERWVSLYDIRIDAGAVSWQGLCHSYSDADALAAELRAAGLSLQPIRTETVPDGVAFTITGRAAGHAHGEGPP